MGPTLSSEERDWVAHDRESSNFRELSLDGGVVHHNTSESVTGECHIAKWEEQRP